jgi:hypothetical protein
LKRLLPVIVAAVAVVVALPVIAQADHRPGHPKPGQPKPPPAGGADLTIVAQPNPTVFRRATVISGRLKGPDNAGKTVTLREDEFPFGTGAKNVATTTTDAKGDYTFTRRPARNTSYQAFTPGTVTYGTVVSQAVLVKVRIRIGLRVSDRTPRVGQLVRFRGVACPAHKGLGVRIQRRTPKGTFRTVRRTKLRAGTRCSAYSRRFRIFRDGTYRVTADDRDHARGFSRTRFLNTPR